jgi:hypothetical protein
MGRAAAIALLRQELFVRLIGTPVVHDRSDALLSRR